MKWWIGGFLFVLFAGSLRCFSQCCPPTITTQPQSQIVTQGSTVTFTVAVSSTTYPTYQWRLNDINIPGATGTNLSIAGVQTTQAGNYSVAVTNAAGWVISSETPLAVVVPPQSQTAAVGYSATFTTTAVGGPAPTYQWAKNGVAIGGATSSALMLSTVSTSTAGNYSVIVSNSAAGALAAAATLTVDTPLGIFTLAGLAGTSGANDGSSTARFNRPAAVAVDSAGMVYVADSSSHTIRKITPSGMVTTLAGIAGVSGSNDGVGSAARFNTPDRVTVDSAGNVYVSDFGNYVIRKISPSGAVSTLAGLAGVGGTNDGAGSNARFGSPEGIAVDSANNIYVGDWTYNTIRKITPVGTNWVVSTIAGLAGNAGSFDGIGSNARFSGPDGLAVDSAGNIFVADFANHTLRKITLVGTNWVVTTLAGLPGSAGSIDGAGSNARFYYPDSAAVDAGGNIYVAEYFGYTIRKVTPSGQVDTLAGLRYSNGSADGTGINAAFYKPNGVAFDSATNIYVADAGNYTIRKGTPDYGQPIIIGQPQSLTVPVGSNATFTATAIGAGPLTYQWRRNGTNIAGATTTGYTRNNVQAADAGNYSIVVSNSSGTATSVNAALAVPAVLIVSQPASQSVVWGGQAAFSVAASGTPPFSYQWYRGSNILDLVALSGATNDVLLLRPLQFSDANMYFVVVSNAYGSVNSSGVVLTVTSPVGGDIDTSFCPGASINASVESVLVQPDGKVLISGTFRAVNGAVRGGIARLKTDGTTDHTFMNGLSGADGGVSSIALQPDGKILIGGPFSSVNGISRGGMARLNVDGSLDTTFQNGMTGVGGQVNAIALQPDGKLLIAGGFWTVNGVARYSIARLNQDGSLDTGFQNGMGGVTNSAYAYAVAYLYAVTPQADGQVLIGGTFNGMNGAARTNIARLNSDGSLDMTFQNAMAGTDSTVESIAVQTDGKVLIGGGFSLVNGTNRNGIARLNIDGSLDSNFGNGMTGAYFVLSVAVQPDSKVIIGGYFQQVNGVARNMVARLNADGSTDVNFQNATGANNSVLSVAQQSNGKVIIGGAFTTTGGQTPHLIGRLNTDGSLDGTFQNGTAGVDGAIYSTALQNDGKLLIGGYLDGISGNIRRYLARLNADGSLDTAFENGMAGAFTIR